MQYFITTRVLKIVASAARFGDLSPFGRLLPVLGDFFLALAIFHLGDFLGDFLK